MDLSKFSFLDGTIVEPGVYRFVALQDDLAAAGRLHGVILTYRNGVWKGVSVGQVVAAGETLGLSGASGVADGPHLHLEVRAGANDYLSLIHI